MHAQQQRQSRIPEQQGIGQTLPPVPVGIDTMHTSPLPTGAMPNGTRLQVGKYQVIIHNFIAEGGFAHVYLARIEGKSGYVVLKRVAVPDAERLKTVEKEIAFMRRLGDHKYIVRYYESRVDPLPIGGFEALILMEYCPGGGVIDLMNRRLQQRLTEPEILKIFSNVCEALAYMHYCQPPVLHRDLKVENILILSQDQYKLCDFGSAALSKGSYVPTSLQEIQKVEDDVQRHTTLQYRAPEMIDIYQKKPINEKADIWALGVLLYKLCYYTTPFEEQGQLAILNAHYSIPQTPYFSNGLRQLIIAMLQEDQQKRPNIYQVVKTVSDLMHVECPIRNIYQEAQPGPASRHESPEVVSRNDSPSSIFEKLPSPPQQLPNITPMRRGRPTRQEKGLSGTPVPSPPPISTPPPPPSVSPHVAVAAAAAAAAAASTFDPFDPTHVKVHGDRETTRPPSQPATPKFGFDSRFENDDFVPSTTTNKNENEDNHEDEESDSNNAPYPWQLESQTLDPISIPPQKHHQHSSSAPGLTATPLQQSTDSGNSSKSAIIPSTKSTKSIRDFMERKRAPETLSPPPSPSSAPPPKATLSSKMPPPTTTSTAATLSEGLQAKKEGPYRPKPPPKPARFRSKPPTTDVTDHVAPTTDSPSSPTLRPPSISEFKDKFPSVEELYNYLPPSSPSSR